MLLLHLVKISKHATHGFMVGIFSFMTFNGRKQNVTAPFRFRRNTKFPSRDLSIFVRTVTKLLSSSVSSYDNNIINVRVHRLFKQFDHEL